jgi:hypothetical protein
MGGAKGMNVVELALKLTVKWHVSSLLRHRLVQKASEGVFGKLRWKPRVREGGWRN